MVAYLQDRVVAAIREYWSLVEEKGQGSYDLFIKSAKTRETLRQEIASFIRAKPEEIVLTKNAHEGICMAINGLPWKRGQKIIINRQEYPSVMKVWEYLEERYGVELIVIQPDSDDQIDPKRVERAIDEKVTLIAMDHVTYDLGSILPAKAIGEIAKRHNILYLLDGAQAIGALPVHVKEIGCDYYAMSGQKALCGPSGTGALYIREGREEDGVPLVHGFPYLLGISSTDSLSEEGDFLSPYHYEAGSQNYAGYIGLNKALQQKREVGIDTTFHHIQTLVKKALETLSPIPGLTILGSMDYTERLFVAFTLEGIPNELVVSFLSTYWNIQLRSLPHCVRVCFNIYNLEEEIEDLREGILHLKELI